MLHLRYGPVLRGLEEAFAVPKGAREAFEARIKNLKRMDFPPSVASSQGYVDYNRRDVVCLVLALKLIGAYVTPAAAARLASRHRVAACVLAGIGLARHLQVPSPSASPLHAVLVLEPAALDALGERGVRAGRYDPPLGGASFIFPTFTTSLPSKQRSRPSTIDGLAIDSGPFATLVAQALEPSGVGARDAFEALSASPDENVVFAEPGSRPMYAKAGLALLQAARMARRDSIAAARAAAAAQVLVFPTEAQAEVRDEHVCLASGDATTVGRSLEAVARYALHESPSEIRGNELLTRLRRDPEARSRMKRRLREIEGENLEPL